jgi:hypothetical protein
MAIRNAPSTELLPQEKMRIHLFPISSIGTIYISIGFRTCGLGSEDKYALELLRVIVGGKYTSRLKLLLREKHGLTYSSYATTDYYENYGDFSLFSVTDSENIIHNFKHRHNLTKKTLNRGHKKRGGGTHKIYMRCKRSSSHLLGKLPGVLLVITNMLHGLLHNGVTAEETHSAKTFIDGTRKMELENGNEPVEYNGTEWLLGNTDKIISYNDLYQTKYAHITRAHIHDAIRKYIKPENMCVSIVGGQLPSQAVVEKYCRRIFR